MAKRTDRANADRTPACGCADGPSSRYNEKHDAYYCRACLTWLETGCSDPECEYCRSRPVLAPAEVPPDGEASPPV